MRSKTGAKGNKNGSGFARVLYVISAVLLLVFVYMLYVNITYISSYTASYGMAFSDMWQEAVQYIVTGSINYFVYAVLVFSAGRIIMMKNEVEVSHDPDNDLVLSADDAVDSTEEFAKLILSEVYLLKQEIENTAVQKAEKKEENVQSDRRKRQYKKRRTL